MKEIMLPELPLHKDVETRRVLKSLPTAHSSLAELKGIAKSIPNQNILINALVLQEAKDSSEIENIITTHDEVYKSELDLKDLKSPEAKEVKNYISALKRGFTLVSEHNYLSNNFIKQIQTELEKNNAGFRTLPGTELKNSTSGEVIYIPPQDKREIERLMANLEHFINDNSLSQYDPIVKMAIIHYQFESIHPFYDGNGRTGRIINILYLILQQLLELPILYLSNYIIGNKGDYYRLLQEVRTKDNWEDWLLFMINGVEETSKKTIHIVHGIQTLMQETKYQIKGSYKFYNQDLLNNLFKHPYTKIDLIMKDLDVSRITATKYLDELTKGGILSKNKLGRSSFYINIKLFKLLVES